MKSKVFSLFEKLDIFGVPVQLTVKGEAQYKTPVGGCISLTIFAFAIYLYVNSATKVLEGGSPLVSNKVQYIQDPKQYIYSYEDFFVGIGLANTTGFPILNSENQTYYDVVLNMVARSPDGSRLYTQSMQLVPCLSEWSDMELIAKYSQSNMIKYAYCLNKTRFREINESYSMQGTYLSVNLKYIKLNVFACRAKASLLPSDCKQKMEKGYALSTISDKLTDQISENPFKSVGRTFIDSFQIDKIQEVRMYFQRVFLLSIQSFYYFSSYQQQYDSIQYQSSRYLTNDLKHLDSEAVISYIWSFGDTETFIYRSYKNMIDVLAETGALINLIILILKLVLQKFTYQLLTKELDAHIYQESPRKQRGSIQNEKNQIIIQNRKSQDRVDLFSIVKQLHQLESIIDQSNIEERNHEPSSWAVNLIQNPEYNPMSPQILQKPKVRDKQIYPEE